jgi:hypothetical protein
VSLQFRGIFNKGKPNLERIEFEALASLNLSFYTVLHSTAIGDGVASGSHPAFWFPSVSLSAGMQINLFTGSNLAPAKIDARYNFFWGLKQTIFNTATDCIVLIQAVNWQTGRVDPPAGLPNNGVRLGDLMTGRK